MQNAHFAVHFAYCAWVTSPCSTGLLLDGIRRTLPTSPLQIVEVWKEENKAEPGEFVLTLKILISLYPNTLIF